jgi:TRAP-type C4-dicarboxylate transport system permease small subunit
MSIGKTIGVLLIAGGALGLLYGGFTYTSQTHSAKLGSLVLAVHEQTDYVPLILSAAAFALGVALLLTLRGRS